jgi:hypothetical protein
VRPIDAIDFGPSLAERAREISKAMLQQVESARKEAPLQRAEEQLEYERELKRLRGETGLKRHQVKGAFVNGSKLRGLRGERIQEAFAHDLGIAVDSLQRGERGEFWADRTWAKVEASGNLGSPVDDLKKEK